MSRFRKTINKINQQTSSCWYRNLHICFKTQKCKRFVIKDVKFSKFNKVIRVNVDLNNSVFHFKKIAVFSSKKFRISRNSKTEELKSIEKDFFNCSINEFNFAVYLDFINKINFRKFRFYYVVLNFFHFIKKCVKCQFITKYLSSFNFISI